MRSFAAAIFIATVTCNQVIYDQMYYQVQMYNAGIAVENLHRFNEFMQTKVQYVPAQPASFEPLRKLCNGQKSSYEFHK